MGPGKHQAPPTNVAAVSEETGSIISQACTSRLEYADRLKVRNVYSLPKVTASRTPQLDSYLKTEIPPATKAVDKELATIQSHVLDALAPLSAILETKQDVPKETVSAVTDAVKLLGNASARISHLRRTKVISQMNKALLPLVEEDSNFGEASPSLFGPEFAQKSKQHVDQVKAMRSTLGTSKPFFRPGPPNSRGGGVTLASRHEEGEEPREDGQAKENYSRRTLGTSDSCTHLYKKCDNELEKYPIESDCMSRSRTLPSTRPAAGRQVGSLFGKLVCHNTGPVGTKYGTGIPDRLCGNATPRVTANSSTLYLGAGHTNTGGNIQTPTETGDTTCGVPLGEGLLLKHISGTQKGWGAKTRHQPQSAKQLCSPRALQDGGNSHPEGPSGAGRLAGKDRPEGHILCNSDTPITSEIPAVSIPRENLPLHLPSLWTLLRPMGVHKDSETSPGCVTPERDSDDCLHRRHTPYSRVQGASSGSVSSCSIPTRVSGIHHQHREICAYPRSDHRVLGSHSQLHQYGATTSSYQDKTDSSRVLTDNEDGGANLSPNTSTPIGQKEFNDMRNSPCTPLLQKPADGSLQCPGDQLPGLRGNTDPLASQLGRAEMVGHGDVQMEWEDSPQEGDRHDYRLRCITAGMGSSLWNTNHKGSMVTEGGNPPHQLFGVAGSNTSSTVICKKQVQTKHPAEDRQYHSSCLHQPSGGDSLKETWSI